MTLDHRNAIPFFARWLRCDGGQQEHRGYGEAHKGHSPISDRFTTTCVASGAFSRLFTPLHPLPGYALRSILAPDLRREQRMYVHVTDPLFAWLRLEDHPHLSTLPA